MADHRMFGATRLDEAMARVLTGGGGPLTDRVRDWYEEHRSPPHVTVGAGLNRRAPCLHLPVRVVDPLVASGHVIWRDADRIAVMGFPDVIASVRRVGAEAEVRIVKVTAPSDAGVDMSGLVALAGDRLLDDAEFAERTRRGQGAAGAVLLRRVRGVLAALPVAPCPRGYGRRCIRYRRPLDAAEQPSIDVDLPRLKRWQRDLASAATLHALRLAGPAHRWVRTPAGASRYSPRLESTWTRVHQDGFVWEPAPEGSVVMRAARIRSAARHLATWLEETDADATSISRARRLSGH